MVNDNQDRESVYETSYPSEEKSTNLTPSVRNMREISSEYLPAKKEHVMHIQMISKYFFQQKKLIYKNKVSVCEVHYSTYDVLVPKNY